MKDLLGMGHLAWDRDYDGGQVRGRGVATDCGYQKGAQVDLAPPASIGGGRTDALRLGERGDAAEVWRDAACDSPDVAPRAALGLRSRAPSGDCCEDGSASDVARRCSADIGDPGPSTPTRPPSRSSPSTPSRTANRRSFPGGAPVKARAMSATRSPDATPPRSTQKRAGYPSPAPCTPSPSKPSRATSTPVKLSRARFDDMRVAPAFGSDSHKESRFASEYARGSLPCHIDHGTCSNRLCWEISADEMATRRSSLLALCVEGLRETRHPHATVARLAFADLATLNTEGGLEEEDLRKVMAGLRLVLTVESSLNGRVVSPAAATSASTVFERGLGALRLVVVAEGARIVPHLHLVLPPIGKKLFLKAHREVVQETLRALEQHGGPEALKVMRRRGVFAGVS